VPDDVLIPVDTLAPAQAELLRRIDLLNPPLAVDPRGGDAGEALARSLLFERWPDLLAGETLDQKRRFYNRYFWFTRFVTLWQAQHGSDAGLEQQAFKLLEQAGPDVDWDLVQRLDERARQET
jgi:hypothetical protein